MAASVPFRLPPLLSALLVLCPALVTAAEAQRVVISQAGADWSAGIDLLDLTTGRTQHLTDDISDKAVFTSDGAVLLHRTHEPQRWRARFMDTGDDILLPDGWTSDRPPARPFPAYRPAATTHACAP